MLPISSKSFMFIFSLESHNSNPLNPTLKPLNTDAAAANAFPVDGIAIIISIVWTKLTKRIARCEIVQNRSSVARTGAAYLAPSAATACTIARISVTKTTAM